MAKIKSVYVCQSCGTKAAQWVGKCNACGEWNTYVEEVEQKVPANAPSTSKKSSSPQLLNAIKTDDSLRYGLVDKELSRVLGGGVVPGSLILFGGEPGIGKSTLMLQLALQSPGLKTLYVSGEESASQIKMRAERIGKIHENCYILTETGVQAILKHLVKLEPDLLIIDSIQTLRSAYIESAPGSISQIRECTNELTQYAKSTATPTFIIGHITKEGVLAGPKVLEHMVDTVLQFEGSKNYSYRLLRPIKNRFGATNELGIYEMVGSGLREVENPSEILISENDEELSGVAIAASLEGIRPMLVEIQALSSPAVYGTPQRSATGFDLRRLNMLLAVLEKRCGFRLGAKDVFLNVAGGVKVDDPAMDLAVVAAILSSDESLTINKKTVFAAEIGLSGEVRAVPRVEQRISEASKLGYEHIFISKYNKAKPTKGKIEVHEVGKIEEVFALLFG